MNASELLHRYWRIPVVGLLAAVLAFAASFLVTPTYESSTRLLVHGRDATFMSSTGQNLTGQPGVIDASLSSALLSTYAGIATSRTVATSVVDDLQLDKAPIATGPVAAMSHAAAWAYRCGRAFLTSGFCAPVDPYERAVREIQEGTTAEPVGTNQGATAGQPGSYVLQVNASGRNPEAARAITDAVAATLVKLSNERFQRDAEKNIVSLQGRVEEAEAELRRRTRAVSEFQTENDISAADATRALSAATLEQVRSDLLAARAELADIRAQLASVQRSLAQVPKDERQKQTIVTGRSTTELNTDSTSSVYNELLTKLNGLLADEAGREARVRRLEEQLDNARPLAQNGPAAELGVLQQSADLASKNLEEATAMLQTAQTSIAQGAVDLSRLDNASAPTYPAAPKRYIYLALGLLIGALAGAALTARVGHAPVAPEPGVEDDLPPLVEEAPPATNGDPVTYVDADTEELQLILAGVNGSEPSHNGNGWRSPTYLRPDA